ncbi:50S ribosomal protein L1 [Patescibacteria group bacterium]|nr:50S ribosomal protein L1 [Patescibacteria group bacterium]
MGKVKTAIMGDIEAEEAARKKAEAKRAQKKAEKAAKVPKKDVLKTEDRTLDQEPLKAEKSDQEIKTLKHQDQKNPLSAVKNIRGKKYLEVRGLVDKKKVYSLKEALDLVKKTSYSKFDGTVELHLNVTEKGLRGMVALPHGTGKQIKVKVADDALIENLSKGGSIDFDILVAHPSMMPKLARVAKILGPKGLMPNPKTGTIGENPEKLVETLSKGQINWKTEADFPIIHTIIGKVSFEPKKLEDNFAALTKAVGKDKIKTAFVKPTMGPAVKVAV